MQKLLQNLNETITKNSPKIRIISEKTEIKITDFIGRSLLILLFLALLTDGFSFFRKPVKTALAIEPAISSEIVQEKAPIKIVEEKEISKFQEITVTQAQKEIDKRNPNFQLTAQQIYDSAKKHDASFTITILQAIQEGNFAKSGKPFATKNVWNWDNTDNGNVRIFQTFEEGMEWYMPKVVKGYGNNTEELLENFVTKTSKKRYASDPNYEKQLKSIYNKIINNN